MIYFQIRNLENKRNSRGIKIIVNVGNPLIPSGSCRRHNIPRVWGDIWRFHHREGLGEFIVLGRKLKEIGIRIGHDTLKARTAFCPFCQSGYLAVPWERESIKAISL